MAIPDQLPLMVSPSLAISDPDLLGSSFNGESWNTWRAVLKAAYGEPLDEDELQLFHSVAGDRTPPTRRVKELWVLAGRRSGKDSIASAVATCASLTDYRQFLRPGERASVLCLAVDKVQAAIVHRYIASYFREVPLLQQLAVRDTPDVLELNNSAEVIISTNSFRSVRGRTISCVVLDEIAFWRDETCANPDVEVYGALVPGLITLPGALLIGITTCYRKSGLAYEQYAKFFGQSDDDILVVYGPSKAFNPTLPQKVIDAAIKRDPEAARAEWLSEWRSDLSDFIDRQLVEAAVDAGVVVRPPQPNLQYVAFADPSGGRGDGFTLGIAHSETTVAYLDLIYEKRPPFDPDNVVNEIAKLLRSYNIGQVTGDRYAAEWVTSAFRRSGITYSNSERDRSNIYLDALPLFTSGRVRLLDNDKLLYQLTMLERRTNRMGRDTVDHGPGPGAHDDVANSAAGALVLASTASGHVILPAALRARLAGVSRDRFTKSAALFNQSKAMQSFRARF